MGQFHGVSLVPIATVSWLDNCTGIMYLPWVSDMGIIVVQVWVLHADTHIHTHTHILSWVFPHLGESQESLTLAMTRRHTPSPSSTTPTIITRQWHHLALTLCLLIPSSDNNGVRMTMPPPHPLYHLVPPSPSDNCVMTTWQHDTNDALSLSRPHPLPPRPSATAMSWQHNDTSSSLASLSWCRPWCHPHATTATTITTMMTSRHLFSCHHHHHGTTS